VGHKSHAAGNLGSLAIAFVEGRVLVEVFDITLIWTVAIVAATAIGVPADLILRNSWTRSN
jgi:hypothetical protein